MDLLAAAAAAEALRDGAGPSLAPGFKGRPSTHLTLLASMPAALSSVMNSATSSSPLPWPAARQRCSCSRAMSWLGALLSDTFALASAACSAQAQCLQRLGHLYRRLCLASAISKAGCSATGVGCRVCSCSKSSTACCPACTLLLSTFRTDLAACPPVLLSSLLKAFLNQRSSACALARSSSPALRCSSCSSSKDSIWACRGSAGAAGVL